MLDWIANTTLPLTQIRMLLEREIMERADTLYDYSLNPPTLVEWERYADMQRIKLELFVLESALYGGLLSR